MARTRRQDDSATSASLGAALAQAVLETLWPTRCALCDAPGELLCPTCKLRLPYIDLTRACRRCGAPFGRMQCTECNDVILRAIGRETLPFEGCVSVVSMTRATGRIVTLYKDRGVRELARTISELMAPCIDPAWIERASCITWIPATKDAVRRRGFDHAELIASHLARQRGIEARALFARPSSKDQRALGRKGRLANMEGRFALLEAGGAPASVIVVDDVTTSGATLFAAADALKESGAREVFCATFARS